MKSLYLAGAMAGIHDFNRPLFHDYAAHWRAAGYSVFNPAEHDVTGGQLQTGPPWTITEEQRHAFMRFDIKHLIDCDAVAVIPGWENSRGAQKELDTARACGIPVLDADTLKPLPAPKQETILEEAQRLVHGPRQAAYSHPHDDYTRTGRMWGAVIAGWLGQPFPDVPARIACLMMAAVKISRESHKPMRDSRVDLAGYAACSDMCAQVEAATPAGKDNAHA